MKILVKMGCIGLGLMLTVSITEVTPYFSQFSWKNRVSLMPLESSDLPMEKRSLKRGGVDYFGDPTSGTTSNSGRINGKNNIRGEMNESGNWDWLSPGRNKRNAGKQKKGTNAANAERKAIGDEAEYRRMENAARRKEARDEKAKKIKSRRIWLKSRVPSRVSQNTEKSEENRLGRFITRKSSIWKNVDKNLPNRISSNHQHKSAQRRKLKNFTKKKDGICIKSKCKATVVENHEGSKTHKAKHTMSATKPRRKSYRGQETKGNEHGNERSKKHETIKKEQHVQNKGNSSKGKLDYNDSGEKVSAKKGNTRQSDQEEAEDSAKTDASAMKTHGKTDGKKKGGGKSKITTKNDIKYGNHMGKASEEYLSPILALGLNSRKRSHTKAQARSQRVHKRPITGGYASAGKLKASSDLYGAYAFARVL